MVAVEQLQQLIMRTFQTVSACKSLHLNIWLDLIVTGADCYSDVSSAWLAQLSQHVRCCCSFSSKAILLELSTSFWSSTCRSGSAATRRRVTVYPESQK